MELYPLQVFLTVATEKSFSRAAEKLLRTQPAVSLALQRLEQELGEKLIDRSGKELILTDAGPHGARLRAPLREPGAGAGELAGRAARQFRRAADDRRQRIHHRFTCCATSSSTGELYPKVKVQVRRSLSSKIPDELLDGNLELGVISYDPGDERLKSKVIYTDALAFVVSPDAPPGASQDGFDHRAGRGEFHRAQRAVAVSRSGDPRVPGAQSAAAHGRGDADHRDHPQDGAEQRRAWRFCRACAWSRKSSRGCCAKCGLKR